MPDFLHLFSAAILQNFLGIFLHFYFGVDTEYRETKKAIERTETAIAAQVRNMREADDSLRKFIEADIAELSKGLERLEKDLVRIEESKVDNAVMLQELNEVRKKLLSFAEYTKDAQPEELVNLISTVVERIYITTENDKRVCHIFVKGCTTEDYTDLFGAAGYIQDSSNPLIFDLCDSEQCREYHMVFTPVTGMYGVFCFIFHFG